MGGKAFIGGKEPLRTPRMPLEVYTLVQQRVRSLLSSHFENIGTPIEAPEKTSYGDVDILVANPKSVLPEPILESLAKIIGASKWTAPSKPVMNFALPYPKLPTDKNSQSSERESSHAWLPSILPTVVTNMIGSVRQENPLTYLRPRLYGKQDKAFAEYVEVDGQDRQFVQVDVQICKTIVDFEWTMFYQAHGDLWNILGSLIRRQGLTVTDKGLYVRIPEIDVHSRKKSMILLTSDPTQALEFMSLDKERWYKPFNTTEEMFDYVTTCRFFYVREEKVEEEMTASDRNRVKTRPVFDKWIKEYLPALRQTSYRNVSTVRDKNMLPIAGCVPLEPMPRKKVLEMALNTFGAGPTAAYADRLKEWEREQQRTSILQLIKETIPATDQSIQEKCGKEWLVRCEAIKGLKTIILNTSTDYPITLKEGIIDSDGLYDTEKLKEFVRRNWLAIGELGYGKLMEKNSGHFKTHLVNEEKRREAV